MIPGKYDITVYRGSTWQITVDAKDDNNVYVDFAVAYINSGGAIDLTVREPWDKTLASGVDNPKPPMLLELSLGSGIELVNTNQSIQLTISAADTKKLKFDSAEYELELSTGDAVPVVDKMLYGKFNVIGDL